MEKGITLMHEHMYIDLSAQKGDDAKLDDFEAMAFELKQLYEHGVRNIVDVTNIGMGRDYDFVKRLSNETNINIITSTGFYQERFFPEEFDNYTIDDIEKIMLDEIENGFGYGYCPKMIAEIGTSKDKVTENERKLFKASARVHNKTGLPISTHCTLGTMAIEQLEILESENVDMSKVILGHTDLICDMDYFYSILTKGANIQFDTIGKNNYKEDKFRIECLKELENSDYEDNIFISMDVTRKSHLSKNGGIGYSYLFDVFIPMCLDAGISQRFIDKIMVDNPQRILKGVIWNN